MTRNHGMFFYGYGDKTVWGLRLLFLHFSGKGQGKTFCLKWASCAVATFLNMLEGK